MALIAVTYTKLTAIFDMFCMVLNLEFDAFSFDILFSIMNFVIKKHSNELKNQVNEAYCLNNLAKKQFNEAKSYTNEVINSISNAKRHLIEYKKQYNEHKSIIYNIKSMAYVLFNVIFMILN